MSRTGRERLDFYSPLHSKLVIVQNTVTHSSFLYHMNIIFPAQGGYSFFSCRFQAKNILVISLFFFTFPFKDVAVTSVWYLDLYLATLCTCSLAVRCGHGLGQDVTSERHYGIRDHSPGICNHNARDQDQRCFTWHEGSGCPR